MTEELKIFQIREPSQNLRQPSFILSPIVVPEIDQLHTFDLPGEVAVRSAKSAQGVGVVAPEQDSLPKQRIPSARNCRHVLERLIRAAVPVRRGPNSVLAICIMSDWSSFRRASVISFSLTE